jgi:UDP-glucose 4-epimerase
MATALVTGGAGFIGSHLADQLLAMGHEVVALDDLSGGFRENLDARVRFVEGSILDRPLLDSLFERYHFDVVYHLAAYAAEGLSHFIKRFNYENNLIGSTNLITRAVNGGVRRFVFTSSIAVYGSATPPMDEQTPPLPEDPYGIAKLAVERDLSATQRLFGLDFVIFRPHNVYGERQNIGDRYRNVIGIFMNQLMQGRPMTIFGDGEQQRAFSYVGDIAPTLARSGFEPGFRNRVFNIGADQAITVNELAHAVARAMGRRAEVVHLPERHEVKVAYSSHARLAEVAGTGPQTPLEEGLRRMAAWALAAGPRRSKPFEGIEIRRNLPAGWNEDEG